MRQGKMPCPNTRVHLFIPGWLKYALETGDFTDVEIVEE